MKRIREESSLFALHNNIGLLDEVSFPRLNLPLTKTPEFINKIESILQQNNTSNLEIPKTTEKLKAMNFSISKITIGHWICDAVYPEDLKVKFYFAKKKLIWESLDFVNAATTTTTTRLKRKIEINWSDVLSFQASYETGILKVELSKRPTFFMETNPHPGKHTQWQHAQDFTLHQSASIFRIHTLHCAPGVLQRNLEKLVSCNSFWSKLFKVRFPTLPESLYFDIGYGNIYNNNNNRSNSFSDRHSYTLSFTDNNFQGPDLSGGSVPESQMNDMTELFGSQAYGNTKLLAQKNEPTYPQVGEYHEGYVAQEGKRENMHHTNLDGSFQINASQQIDVSLYVDYNYDEYINNNNGSVFHDVWT